MTRHMPAGPLQSGSTIGILGGGQLGRMLALAAARYGFKTHLYSPEPDSPAFHVASHHTCAPYSDRSALQSFAASVDIVTFEFENVPAETAGFLAGLVPIEPRPQILEISQDRFHEKTFLGKLGLRVTDFAPVSNIAEFAAAIGRIGRPCVLKTRRLGYDGKGQMLVDAAMNYENAWQAIGAAPAILEAFVPFSSELSVIVARGYDGTTRLYDVSENRHHNHILHTSTVPAAINRKTAQEARGIAGKIADALEYIGVLAVELFLVREGGEERLLVNEIAPRVHNSGHWTEDACQISQFGMHIRAVAGWPLPEPWRFYDVQMQNLLGHDVEQAFRFAAEPGACIHLYGKTQAREGRKMGHINWLKPLRNPNS